MKQDEFSLGRRPPPRSDARSSLYGSLLFQGTLEVCSLARPSCLGTRSAPQARSLRCAMNRGGRACPVAEEAPAPCCREADQETLRPTIDRWLARALRVNGRTLCRRTEGQRSKLPRFSVPMNALRVVVRHPCCVGCRRGRLPRGHPLPLAKTGCGPRPSSSPAFQFSQACSAWGPHAPHRLQGRGGDGRLDADCERGPDAACRRPETPRPR